MPGTPGSDRVVSGEWRISVRGGLWILNGYTLRCIGAEAHAECLCYTMRSGGQATIS
jgi:hypothetical protein